MQRFEELEEMNIKYTVENYGFSHSQTCQVTSAYALQLTLKKEFERGEKYIRKAIKSCGQALGKNHFTTIAVKAYLAANLDFQGKERQSNKLYHQTYKQLKLKNPTSNHVKKRKIRFLLRLYRKLEPYNKQKIDAYASLIEE